MTNPIDQTQSCFPPNDSKLKLHSVLTQFRTQANLRFKKYKYLSKGKYHTYRLGELRRGYPELNAPVAKDIAMTVHLVNQKNWASKLGKVRIGESYKD